MHSLVKIQQSFQRALHSYNDNATLQRHIAQRLVEIAIQAGLPKHAKRTLEIGCGTGFLTQQLVSHVSAEQAFINDLVADCETYLQAIMPEQSKWQFITGAIESIDIPAKLDLISSASTVQWVTDLTLVLQQLTQQLNNKGYLLISSFTDQHFTELRQIQQLLSPPTQTDQQPTSTPLNYWSESQWREALKRDYTILALTSETHIAEFASIKELLMHLRLTGVNGNTRQRWTQQHLKQFEQVYAEHFQEHGKFKLSYQPIYLIAQKQDGEI